MRFPRPSGAVRRPPARALAAVAAALALTACSLSPYKFAGGGLPRSIRTVAVLPFDNQTPVAELQRDLLDRFRRGLQNRLNLRDAAETRADAIVKGTIVKYDADVPIGYSADPRRATDARRELQIVIDIAIIEQSSGRTLWERKGLTAKADYPDRGELTGRQRAYDLLVDDVVEGAQSQW